MRYVLDTCVVVSALRSKRGASNAVLSRVLRHQLPIVLHFKLLAEYRDVLMRPEIRLATGLSELRIERFLAALVGVADEVAVQYLWRPNLRDEDDNFIVEIAVAASPCTIVTHNVRDFRQSELKFANVHLANPAQLLNAGIQ